mgnify:CR=1 FL=1
MKTIIKLSSTIFSVLMIVAGLVSLFTIDNAQNLISLMVYAIIMIMEISGGIYLLTLVYPELIDLSEFEGDTISMLKDYEREIDELRDHNLLLSDRYMTFKSIIKSSKIINEDNKEKYPNLYKLIYEEDLVGERTKLQEPSLEQIDRFKEIYN